MRKLLVLVVCLVMLSGCGAFHNGSSNDGLPQYTIREIDMFSETDTWCGVYALNDAGQVVCDSSDDNYNYHNYLWEDGVKTELDECYVNINNLGQMIGGPYVVEMNYEGNHVYLNQDGITEDLGTINGFGAFGKAINDSGQIVGIMHTSQEDNEVYGFLWDNGEVTNLGALQMIGIVNDINNQCQIVGKSNEHAFLWENGEMSDLGTLGGDYSEAHAINNNGEIVGGSRTNGGEEHPFLWRDGSMIDLGIPEMYAKDINDSGYIVGNSYGGFNAFIWVNGVKANLQDLIPPDSGWLIQNAVAINNSCQIIGFGIHNNEYPRCFIMTPVE